MLNLRGFSECERILDVDAQVPNGAFDFRMAKQDLHRAQVARLLIDDRGFGSSQRVRSVVLRPQSDPDHPLINEPGILPGADMIGVIDPARKGELVNRSASAFEPCQNSAAGGFEEFKLNRPACLLLDDDRPRADLAAADEVADLDLDDVPSRQLAVDREIEHRSVA